MKFTGQTSVALPTTRIWDPRTGFSNILRWRGMLAEMEALFAGYQALGNKCQLEPDDDGSYATLSVQLGAEATQAPDEPLSSQWSLVGNDLEKSIWELPKIQAILSTKTAQVRGDFRRYVDEWMRGEKTITEIMIAFDAAEQTVIEEFLGCLASGVEAFSLSQFVLRHVVIIALNSTIRPAYTNIAEIFTTAQLAADEAIPVSIRFELPKGEWLKRTPTVEQTASDKWTITQEWWHADVWSRFLYDPVA